MKRDFTSEEKISGKIIKKLIDRMASDEEKHFWLSDVMFTQPGEFWPAISTRTLGSKRIFWLELAAEKMVKSENEDIRIAGLYMRKALESRRRKLRELDEYSEMLLKEARKLMKAGDFKKAKELHGKAGEAMQEAIDLIKEEE